MLICLLVTFHEEGLSLFLDLFGLPAILMGDGALLALGTLKVDLLLEIDLQLDVPCGGIAEEGHGTSVDVDFHL